MHRNRKAHRTGRLRLAAPKRCGHDTERSQSISGEAHRVGPAGQRKGLLRDTLPPAQASSAGAPAVQSAGPE